MTEVLKKLRANRTARILLIAAIALALLLACWCVFGSGQKDASAGYVATEEEARIASMLSGIEGVREVRVMIAEEDGKPVSAVVMFGGEDGILVRLRLTQVTARALGLSDGSVHVYPSGK